MKLENCPLTACVAHTDTPRHVHLHVISGDLVSPSLKTKKHYNSFNPKLGFFIPLDEADDVSGARSGNVLTSSRLIQPGYRVLAFSLASWKRQASHTHQTVPSSTRDPTAV